MPPCEQNDEDKTGNTTQCSPERQDSVLDESSCSNTATQGRVALPSFQHLLTLTPSPLRHGALPLGAISNPQVPVSTSGSPGTCSGSSQKLCTRSTRRILARSALSAMLEVPFSLHFRPEKTLDCDTVLPHVWYVDRKVSFSV